ncbi:GntR family transcriptional regulator [Streptomyces agglomeratus]|uniref:GntR family transcriptional regulator n=1 Tax=Streptomyces agglomeratus TaxID=285458 RepID=A0A1E5PCB9_9ACTN|nr:PLP-dependent aminotransferase family protein [Streptomyces agglomeratus]OEJ27183.1 GntR family transcriptional regulator [Streptomyces agglomeratus]OEJ38764.1 GntR family transcriptional regulator [Streptomyces agglomeratus]OEJ46851.1 GntR family transcriptional regulator [Streptomyces agglomeratus]OEJ51293.1 GntR family transcriptional regulator [Streptomyces agglomeratus]OEJ58661.1 GntR family transcriptional regulator [Streptomyces agglomeratus]
MAESWVNSAEGLGSDLHLELAAAGSGSRRAVLMRALREAIRGGRLAPGTRLPPYRSLAADLGLARNTVADAYAELVAEGWLTARQGSGTRVALRAAPATPAPRRRTPVRDSRPAYDLVQGRPDPSAFPRGAWLASARRALTAAPPDAFGPGDPRGRAELREALAEYLARVRGVRADAGRIVLCSGAAHALRLLARVVGGTWAVEAYGLPFHRALLADEGVRTVALEVDDDGAEVGELAGLAGTGTVLLTPAHQFPTGGPLRPERRAAVVDWARATGGLVLEDDYDGEFRYDRQPVGAVQGLDPDHVVLIGSVSKSLSPTLRIGWMVLPERLLGAVVAAKGEREQWSSATEQLTLADFVASGAYDRHVRRMRQRHRRRRDQLVAVLAERAPHVRVTGIAAGLHAVLELPPGTERAVVKAAAWQGLAVEGLSDYRHPDSRRGSGAGGAGGGRDGLVVGYSTPAEHAYAGALDALCRALPPA